MYFVKTLWYGIKDRCYNINSKNYLKYGLRGIKMNEDWILNYHSFAAYVSSLPNFGKKDYTLDRINNNDNYDIGNLRWATIHIQNSNQRKQKNNTSGFVGVGWIEKRNRWQAKISINKKMIYLGFYLSKEEAYQARKNFILKNNHTEYLASL